MILLLSVGICHISLQNLSKANKQTQYTYESRKSPEVAFLHWTDLWTWYKNFNELYNLLTDDLSANKNTTQYKTHVSCPSCIATRAVDRNIDTCTQTDMGITAPD